MKKQKSKYYVSSATGGWGVGGKKNNAYWGGSALKLLCMLSWKMGWSKSTDTIPYAQFAHWGTLRNKKKKQQNQEFAVKTHFAPGKRKLRHLFTLHMRLFIPNMQMTRTYSHVKHNIDSRRNLWNKSVTTIFPTELGRSPARNYLQSVRIVSVQ